MPARRNDYSMASARRFSRSPAPSSSISCKWWDNLLAAADGDDQGAS